MKNAQPFDPLEPGEIDDFAWDFTQEMGAATLIVSTDWTCALAPYAAGTDPTPQARILTKQAQTQLPVRNPDGTLTYLAGFFSVARVGTMPTTAAGSNYILEATVVLNDNRILKRNTTVLCSMPGL